MKNARHGASLPAGREDRRMRSYPETGATAQLELFAPRQRPARRRPYGGRPPQHKDASPTEVAAAERIREFAPTLKDRVFGWIQEAREHGLSPHEAGAKYAASRGRPACDGSSRYSVAPRFCELAKDGGIEFKGIRYAIACVQRRLDEWARGQPNGGASPRMNGATNGHPRPTNQRRIAEGLQC